MHTHTHTHTHTRTHVCNCTCVRTYHRVDGVREAPHEDEMAGEEQFGGQVHSFIGRVVHSTRHSNNTYRGYVNKKVKACV